MLGGGGGFRVYMDGDEYFTSSCPKLPTLVKSKKIETKIVSATREIRDFQLAAAIKEKKRVLGEAGAAN